MSPLADYVRLYFTHLGPQAPMLLALAAGILVVAVKWREGGRGSSWALAGLLLGLAGALLGQLAFALIQGWTRGIPADRVSHLFTLNTVFWAGVRGASLLLLTIAVFAGRPVPPAPR